MESIELVKRVINGDTFETAGAEEPVRLLNVDAPEIHDYLGEEAQWHLTQLMGSGAVQVDFVDYDRHGRRLAWVKCGGRSVNQAMKEYLAEHGYSTGSPSLHRDDDWPV